MKYLIALQKSKYGYHVSVPALPGCHSQGSTKREALCNVEDAILTYLDVERLELRNTEFREVEIAFA